MSARLRATTGCGARLTEWQGMYASLLLGYGAAPAAALVFHLPRDLPMAWGPFFLEPLSHPDVP
jgi:hypothetical protein